MAKPTKPQYTHLVGRTRRTHFNRGGIRFEQRWTAHLLSALSKEQLDAIRGEHEIESRLVEADEAAELTATKVDGAEEARISRAELLHRIELLTRDNAELRAEVERLEIKLRGDMPPKPGEPVVGSDAAPLPLPPMPQR